MMISALDSLYKLLEEQDNPEVADVLLDLYLINEWADSGVYLVPMWLYSLNGLSLSSCIGARCYSALRWDVTSHSGSVLNPWRSNGGRL
jgi:hypothetical protein